MVTENLGYFDESGKFADHSIVAFCGLMNTVERWETFKPEWRYCLRHHGITSLHMSKGALNFKRQFSAKRPALGREDRIKVLSTFIVAIKQHVELGVVADMDVRAYKNLKSHIQQKVGDPYFVSFKTALIKTLDYVKPTPDSILSVMCDDEEQYAPLCYKLFNKVRREYPALRKLLSSICFGDDELILPLQAADLLAYIVRSESARKFHGVHSECDELYAKLLSVDDGDKIKFIGGTWVAPDTLKPIR